MLTRVLFIAVDVANFFFGVWSLSWIDRCRGQFAGETKTPGSDSQEAEAGGAGKNKL